MTAKIYQFTTRRQSVESCGKGAPWAPWDEGVPCDPPSRRPDASERELRWCDGFEAGEGWARLATDAELDCAAQLFAAAEGKAPPFLWVIYPSDTLARFWGVDDGPADVPVGDLHSDDMGYAAGFACGVDKYFRGQWL